MTPSTITLRDLSSFDWFMLTLVIISVILAFRRGIIRVLFSLAGLVAGIVLASWNYSRLAVTLHRWIASTAAAQILAFLLILIGVMVVFTLAAGLVRKTAAAVGLGFFDRLLGAGFGLVRGTLLGVAVVMAIASFAPDSAWIRDSRLTPYFLAGAHAVSFVVPRGLQEQLTAGAAHLLQQT